MGNWHPWVLVSCASVVCARTRHHSMIFNTNLPPQKGKVIFVYLFFCTFGGQTREQKWIQIVFQFTYIEAVSHIRTQGTSKRFIFGSDSYRVTNFLFEIQCRIWFGEKVAHTSCAAAANPFDVVSLQLPSRIWFCFPLSPHIQIDRMRPDTLAAIESFDSRCVLRLCVCLAIGQRIRTYLQWYAQNSINISRFISPSRPRPQSLGTISIATQWYPERQMCEVENTCV